MRSWKLLVGLIVLSSLPMMGAPVMCPATGTYATLQTLSGPGDGCLINGLLFNNFGLVPTATGSGTVPTASQISYTLDDPGTSLTGEQIYGFEFNPDLSVIGIGSEDVLLTYTIIATAPIISSVHLLETAITAGAATATVAEGPDRACTGVGTGCIFLPILNAIPGGAHDDFLGVGPYTEVDVRKDINVTSVSAGASNTATISGVRDAVDLTTATSTVPEPVTYVYLLAGLALIGLGRKRWWFRP